jgi:peroxiredoxin
VITPHPRVTCAVAGVAAGRAETLVGKVSCKSADALSQQADAYVINSDSPQDSQRLKQITHTTLPVLLDRQLAWARQYDMLPKSNQPMGMMSGVGQMGFVVIDASGTIRVQRPCEGHAGL